ncbi:xyloglucan endotransglucosylase/hydrolase protein 2-like [Capsicum annuum]|uniref:xyloglucan endotransglucosylase/hydrolase protein 2-like n=1 Tax=Capsicum annuum TaxID=4072 RepID=UPI0007BEC7A1|nr:xyloglucan endotransglucosylase/hydrolase protein 2-like [Capsicum annuum]
MGFHLLSLGALLLLLTRVFESQALPFDKNYNISWGNNNVKSLNKGEEIQLSLDKNSGCGIQSKQSYGSGSFKMRIKLPSKDSAGVVTTFYLHSHTSHHDELDFEFLGNREGKPHTLQTNVFANGVGDREQRIQLWFDPTTNFHDYSILWNSHQIVFFVDEIPIRVYKNHRGIGYPSQPMQSEATIWNGETWATENGKAKINWSNSPFIAQFQGFNIEGCSSNYNLNCNSTKLWWNYEKFWKLNQDQEKSYQDIRSKNIIYDYCKDTNRFQNIPLECLK